MKDEVIDVPSREVTNPWVGTKAEWSEWRKAGGMKIVWIGIGLVGFAAALGTLARVLT